MIKHTALALLAATTISNAAVNHISVEYCRPVMTMFLGRINEQQTMDHVNDKMQRTLDQVGATKIDYMSYTNIQSFFRSKQSACIYATAWYEE